MGTWRAAHWEADDASGVPRAERRGGVYHTYTPDPLVGNPLVLDPALDHAVARTERAVRAVQADHDLIGIARFLLRSEAIASSRIEGIAPSARNVGLAELAVSESVPRVDSEARLVAQNMTVVRTATSRLVVEPEVTVDHIVDLHRSLMPDQPDLHGVRTRQNWIGGASRTPIGAEFIPPAPDEVPELLADLVTYLNGATHSPIVQAALVHAQFETIHPFADGNGRVGRALIHTVLTRRGLTPGALLPVSLVLATLRDDYVTALNSYRVDGVGATAAMGDWIAVFTRALGIAVEQSRSISQELAEVRDRWSRLLDADRARRGAVRALRGTSATAAVLADLPSTPVLTPATVTRIHGVSHPAAVNALSELAAAGILSVRSLGRARKAYLADDVLDLVTRSERRLASTQFDTRVGPPNRVVPARPESL